MMKKTLYVENNFFYLSQLNEHYERIIYCPKVHSSPQRLFFNDRFIELKKRFPKIEKGRIEFDKHSYLLGWDSYDEISLFHKNILPLQNRLFSELPFNIPDGFSSFGKKAKKSFLITLVMLNLL